MGPMLAPWSLLSGCPLVLFCLFLPIWCTNLVMWIIPVHPRPLLHIMLMEKHTRCKAPWDKSVWHLKLSTWDDMKFEWYHCTHSTHKLILFLCCYFLCISVLSIRHNIFPGSMWVNFLRQTRRIVIRGLIVSPKLRNRPCALWNIK